MSYYTGGVMLGGAMEDYRRFQEEMKGQKMTREERKKAYQQWKVSQGLAPVKKVKKERKVRVPVPKKAENPRGYDIYNVRERLFGKTAQKPLRKYTAENQVELDQDLQKLGSGVEEYRQFQKEMKGKLSGMDRKVAYEAWKLAKAQAQIQKKVRPPVKRVAENPRAYDVYNVRERLFGKTAPKPLRKYTAENQVELDQDLQKLGSGMRKPAMKRLPNKRGGEWYDEVWDVTKAVAPALLPLLL